MVLFDLKKITIKVIEYYVNTEDIGTITINNKSRDINRRYCKAELKFADALTITQLSDLIIIKASIEYFKNISIKRRTSSGRVHEDYGLKTEHWLDDTKLFVDIFYKNNHSPMLRFSTMTNLDNNYYNTVTLNILEVMTFDIALHKAITAINCWFLGSSAKFVMT